jgi:hypothetical protein
MAASGADNPTRREQPKTMSTNLSNKTFGAAMAGNDTAGARPRRHPVSMKMLVSGAIAVGVWVGVAAPASGDVNSVGANPSQFGALRSSCQHTASPSGRAGTEEMQRGIRDGLAAGLGKPQP